MKYLALITFFLLGSINMYSQDDRLDEFTFEEQEFDQQKKYFGIGGGYSGSFFIQDMTDINKFISDLDYGLNDLPDNVYHHGLELMSSTVIVPNTRIGFFRYSGTSKVTNDVELEGTLFKRAVEYSNFMTGVPLEYAFMPFNSFAIIPSVALGYGTNDIDIIQTKNKVDFEVEDFSGQSYIANIGTSYWFVMPKLNLEYAFTQFTVIRLSAFYMTSFAQNWKFNRESTLDNVPSGFNPQGYALQIGLFVGLFNY